MKINQRLFKSILLELIDENPLACQGVLSILGIEFTDRVQTLSVSLEDPPRLLVNLDFLAENAHNETHVKCALLHEFLHVLLNHTERFQKMDYATNLALDAVINHIIHRSEGEAYSDFFRQYYQGMDGWMRLLSPTAESELRGRQDPFVDLQRGLLTGRVVADDLLEIARSVRGTPGGCLGELPEGRFFVGNHSGDAFVTVSREAAKALKNTLKSYNGSGIYRSPKDRGFGAVSIPQRLAGKPENLLLWERSALKILRKLSSRDVRSPNREVVCRSTTLPVLIEGDRRGFLRSLWSPLMLDNQWDLPHPRPGATTAVYLDVSGSMNGEMQALVHLLTRLSAHIQKPFWAFSDEVAPAVIRRGILETSTSGGTSMNAVLKHFAGSDREKAVVITDGYIEDCDETLLARVKQKSLFAIVSRDGSAAQLEAADIPYFQLEPFPGGRVS
jgi:hypothetical protein